jgi:hypothetical protein
MNKRGAFFDSEQITDILRNTIHGLEKIPKEWVIINPDNRLPGPYISRNVNVTPLFVDLDPAVDFATFKFLPADVRAKASAAKFAFLESNLSGEIDENGSLTYDTEAFDREVEAIWKTELMRMMLSDNLQQL